MFLCQHNPAAFADGVKYFSIWVLVTLLVICGCSKKPESESAQNNTGASGNAVDPPSTKSEPSGNDSELAIDLVQLMQRAEQQNAEGEFDQAYQTWQLVHQRVSEEFGLDAWQTISAELAMNAARQRTNMSPSDQQQVVRLAALTANSLQLIEKQKFNEARLDIEKAAGISTRIWGKESFVSANINFNRARCYLGLGMQTRAIAVLNDVLTLRISLTGLYHPDVETTLDLLARANTASGDHSAAQQALEKLVDVSEHLWGKNSAVYADRCNELGVSYNNDRKAALAMKWFDEAIRVRKKNHGPRSIQVAHVLMNRGLAQVQLQEFESAQNDLEQTLELFQLRKLNPRDPSWAVLYDQLGTVSLIRKQNSTGQKYFSQLADYWKNRENAQHIEYAKSLFKLSVSIGNQGKYAEAEPIMKKAIGLFEKQLGRNHRMLQQPLTTYARLLEKMGVDEQAKRIRDRAVRLAGFQELPK